MAGRHDPRRRGRRMLLPLLAGRAAARAAARAGDPRDDDGIALIATIGAISVISILVVGIVATSIRVSRQTREDADWHAALAAAEAGMDDLVYRLNADQYYWQVAETDPANPARTSWVTLPDITVPAADDPTATETLPSRAAYTYTVDEDVRGSGAIRLTVTGRVGDRTRTIASTIRRSSFLDFLYFTEFETRPPAAYSIWPSREVDRDEWPGETEPGSRPVWAVGEAAAEEAAAQCAYTRYGTGRAAPRYGPDTGIFAADGNPATIDDGRHPYCREPHWTDDNQFVGPFHTNDALALRDDSGAGGAGTRFVGNVTSSWDVGPRWLDVRATVGPGVRDGRPATRRANPTFNGETDGILYRSDIRMPASNEELRQVAAAGGCVFEGPTRIVLQGGVDDAGLPGGRRPGVYVDSPASGGVCGLPASGTNAGAGTLTLPADFNGVLYVANREGASCGTISADELPLTGRNGTGVPDYARHLGAEDTTDYSCRDGDAFVEGTLAGRLTIGAQRDVVIVDDVDYEGFTSGARVPADGQDATVLGLVPNRFAYLFNPIDCKVWLDGAGRAHRKDTPAQSEQGWVCLDGTNIGYRDGGRDPLRSPRVYAAILAVQQAMTLQNAQLGGGLGRLQVVGVIAQRYRGDLGTAGGNQWTEGGRLVTGGSAGYGKQFTYDTRLQYLSPPHFLQPAETAWGPVTFTEQRPALDGDDDPATAGP